jgi:twitching motility protein PilT
VGGQVPATLEDPVELPLHGHIGGGFCLQKNVNPDDPYEERFARGIVDAMREFPGSAKSATLVVGEVRDAETAGQLVRAANNGMLVITTVHASNARTALQRLFTLAAQTMGETVALQDLALATRVVIHQRLDFPDPAAIGWQRGRLTGEVLFVAGDDAPASSIIRSGDLNKLKDVIDQQRIWLTKREPTPSFHELQRALSGQQG